MKREVFLRKGLWVNYQLESLRSNMMSHPLIIITTITTIITIIEFFIVFLLFKMLDRIESKTCAIIYQWVHMLRFQGRRGLLSPSIMAE